MVGTRPGLGPRFAGLALAMLALVGCGEATPSAAPGDSTSSAIASVTAVSCGGPVGWQPADMPEGVDGLITDAEVAAAFEDMSTGSFAGEAPSFLTEGLATPWRALTGTDEAVTLGLGEWTVDGPAKGARVLDLRREGVGWRFAGGGDCGGRPPVPRLLTLAAPLGDRTLLDGSVFPPRSVGE